MNKENLEKLKEAILLEKEAFTMNHYMRGCGSPACIAGHAAVLNNPDEVITPSGGGYGYLALKGRCSRKIYPNFELEEFLEIPRLHAVHIATQFPGEAYIEAEDACEFLDWYAETNCPDWNRFYYEIRGEYYGA